MQVKNWELVRARITGLFSGFRKTAAVNIGLLIAALLDCGSFNTQKLSASISKLTGNSFHSSENRLRRFLSTDTFEVGDKAFRILINLVFSFLKPAKGQLIQINIDYTSERDNFLILMASTPFVGRSFPLYFSIRRYAKEKSRFDQKKMELAFLKELKHLLPKKKYEYLLVLDRGFASPRLLKMIPELGFKYLIRTNDNWKIELNGQAQLISELPKIPAKDKVTLVNAKIETNLVRNFESLGEWFLFTNLEAEIPQIICHYMQRFQIEKTFQDEKSSGFDLETTKITDYSRFKKLFFLTCLAQTLTMFVGDFLDKKLTPVKKNFAL